MNGPGAHDAAAATHCPPPPQPSPSPPAAAPTSTPSKTRGLSHRTRASISSYSHASQPEPACPRPIPSADQITCCRMGSCCSCNLMHMQPPWLREAQCNTAAAAMTWPQTISQAHVFGRGCRQMWMSANADPICMLMRRPFVWRLFVCLDASCLVPAYSFHAAESTPA